tara:strand:- start:655 stop:1164 length:510 start_codon:yes stop_codon:yes gene_type:complete
MKKFYFFLLILIFIPFNTFAKIAYIDLNLILNNSDVGKFVNAHIEKIKKENYSKYKEQENKLIEQEKLLISQKNILNEDEFKKKILVLTEEVEKYRSDKKDSIDRINKIKINYTKEILKSLNPIIAKYVDLNSISIVIPKKNIIVGKKNLDITDQIIKLLNDNIKKINF